MEKPIGLADMCPEILSTIMDKLSIGDASNLGRTYSSASTSYKHRTDIVSYIGATFKFPYDVICGMYATRCVISGSRACEFFIPGSVDTSSDWDFFVDNDPMAVGHMMLVLESCGVEWENCLSMLIKAERKHGTGPYTIRILGNIISKDTHYDKGKCARYINRKSDSPYVRAMYVRQRMIDAYVSLGMAAGTTVLLEVQDNNVNISEVGAAVIRLDNNKASAYDQDVFNVVVGRLCTPTGNNVPINLILSPSSPWSCGLEVVSRFYASHIQCYISATHAIHCYHDTACKKQGIVYNELRRSTSISRLRIELAVGKYTARGWDLTLPIPFPPEVRTIEHEGVAKVKFYDMWDTIISSCAGPDKVSMKREFTMDYENLTDKAWAITKERGCTVMRKYGTHDLCTYDVQATFPLDNNTRHKLCKSILSIPNIRTSSGYSKLITDDDLMFDLMINIVMSSDLHIF